MLCASASTPIRPESGRFFVDRLRWLGCADNVPPAASSQCADCDPSPYCMTPGCSGDAPSSGAGSGKPCCNMCRHNRLRLWRPLRKLNASRCLQAARKARRRSGTMRSLRSTRGTRQCSWGRSRRTTSRRTAARPNITTRRERDCVLGNCLRKASLRAFAVQPGWSSTTRRRSCT